MGVFHAVVVKMSSVTFQFKGKTALVTGAGQGNLSECTVIVQSPCLLSSVSK